MDIADPIRVCYDWQRDCMEVENWAHTLKETEKVEAQHTFGRISRKKITRISVR
jgi:hypothetical protein